MIVMEVLTIAYGTPMDPLIAVHVSLGNKQEDHVAQAAVAETLTRDIKNNATLRASVDLEHVTNEPPLIKINNIPIKAQNKINILHIKVQTKIRPLNKPLVKPLMIVMEVLTIAYTHPTDHHTVVHVYLGNKQEDHVAQVAVVETRLRDIKNNATLHANVDLEHVNKNKPLIQSLFQPLN
jgi:hypothetical protein